jgi:hypothetical protein
MGAVRTHAHENKELAGALQCLLKDGGSSPAFIPYRPRTF